MIFKSTCIQASGHTVDCNTDKFSHSDVKVIALIRYRGIACIRSHDTWIQLKNGIPHRTPFPGAPGLNELLFCGLLVFRPFLFHDFLSPSCLYVCYYYIKQLSCQSVSTGLPRHIVICCVISSKKHTLSSELCHLYMCHFNTVSQSYLLSAG